MSGEQTGVTQNKSCFIYRRPRPLIWARIWL